MGKLFKYQYGEKTQAWPGWALPLQRKLLEAGYDVADRLCAGWHTYDGRVTKSADTMELAVRLPDGIILDAILERDEVSYRSRCLVGEAASTLSDIAAFRLELVLKLRPGEWDAQLLWHVRGGR